MTPAGPPAGDPHRPGGARSGPAAAPHPATRPWCTSGTASSVPTFCPTAKIISHLLDKQLPPLYASGPLRTPVRIMRCAARTPAAARKPDKRRSHYLGKCVLYVSFVAIWVVTRVMSENSGVVVERGRTHGPGQEETRRQIRQGQETRHQVQPRRQVRQEAAGRAARTRADLMK